MKERSILTSLLSPVLAVLVAFTICAFIIILAGFNPLTAYRELFLGAFGSTHGFGETIVQATPLLLIGLGLAVAFRCHFFNIGAPGQLFIGALAATVVGLTFSGLHPILLFSLMMAVGFLGGAAYGVIPALLKTKLNVHEVICTILLNYIAFLFVSYLIEGPMKEPWSTAAITPAIPSSVWLPKLLPGSRLHAGILIAFVCILLIYVILERTTLGYRIKVVGSSPEAARYVGISGPKIIVISMIISGGLAGLAGAIELTGIFYRLQGGFTFAVGFTAIPITYLGRNHPVGVGLAAFLFGALVAGGTAMTRATGVPIQIVYALQGLVLLSMLVSEYLVGRKG